MTTRRLTRRNPRPLFAPTTESEPPGKVLCKMVCALVFAASRTSGVSTGQSRSMGAISSFEKPSASSTVGCTTMIGHGSWSMWYPMVASIIFV
jgi:hypothetical protein